MNCDKLTAYIPEARSGDGGCRPRAVGRGGIVVADAREIAGSHKGHGEVK